MSSDLAVPGIGSIVRYDRPDEIAVALADIRDLEAKLRDVKRELAFALEQESERQGTKTLRYGDLTVTLSTPTEIVWDVEELEKLLEAGLPQDRYEQLVTTEISYKVNAREASHIAAANPEYAKIIERARTDHSAGTARVSVKR